MEIIPNSPLFDELFGHLTGGFESRLPSHQVYVDALNDPSVGPEALGQSIGTSDEIPGVLHSAGVWDLINGTQRMIKEIAVRHDGVSGPRSNGFLRELTGPVASAMTPPAYAMSLASDVVGPVLTATKEGGASGAASAAIAVGMTALSTMGPIGQAAAAIVGFASFVVNLVKKKSELQALQDEERLAAIYESMPPLQRPGSETDSNQVDLRIMSIMQTGNWTPLFLPRFDPRAEWVGVERHGGFAFAPGKTVAGEPDPFGRDTQYFEVSNGLGFVPGFNKITSVVQVSLDAQSPVLSGWREHGGHYPIKKGMVRDVGDFYVNTGRLCANAWEWVRKRTDSTDMYKVFVGTRQSDRTDCMHYQWRSYCQGGLEYLLENGRQWKNWHDEGLIVGGRVKDPENPEFLFGAAIGCAIGAWSCTKTYEGKMRQVAAGFGYPYHHMGGSMGAPLGCIVDPATALVRAGGQPCLTTIYHIAIAKTLDALRARQLRTLRTKPVCAFVRQSWDAFKDDELKAVLLEARTKLLKHPLRFTISLDDIPTDEPFKKPNGQVVDWREECRRAGVKKIPGPSQIVSVGATSDDPSFLEPLHATRIPEVPDPIVAMPWTEHVPVEWWRNPRNLWWAFGLGTAGLVARGLIRRRRAS